MLLDEVLRKSVSLQSALFLQTLELVLYDVLSQQAFDLCLIDVNIHIEWLNCSSWPYFVVSWLCWILRHRVRPKWSNREFEFIFFEIFVFLILRNFLNFGQMSAWFSFWGISSRYHIECLSIETKTWEIWWLLLFSNGGHSSDNNL